MLYPLRFRPRYKERIWGGSKMAPLTGRKLPDGKRIGESWEISAVQRDLSVVSNGKLKGNNIEELTEVFMGDLVGEKVYEKFGIEFPLLLKLIDAGEQLSVQVHPGDELAAEEHNSYGKTEMWHILDAEPGSFIYLGFNRDITEEAFHAAVSSNTLPELMNRVEVKKGETYFIPAGTIHVIGSGIMLAEIQQTSDVIYRIDDWGRTGADGKPRELHTHMAARALDYDRYDPSPLRPGADGTVCDCSYFTVKELTVDGDITRDHAGLDSFVIYFCAEGSATVTAGDRAEKLAFGQSVLIPAEEEAAALSSHGKLLEIYIK